MSCNFTWVIFTFCIFSAPNPNSLLDVTLVYVLLVFLVTTSNAYEVVTTKKGHQNFKQTVPKLTAQLTRPIKKSCIRH